MRDDAAAAGTPTEESLQRRHRSYRHGAAGVHGAPGGSGAAPASPSDSVSRCAGPHAKLRSQIVPAPPERAPETSSEDAHAQGAPARISWARLLKRVFDIDVEHCPNCGG